MIHNWSRQLPENCELDYFRIISDQIMIGLYCRDYLIEVRVNAINGKVEIGERKRPELRSRVELRKNFYIISCYQGKDRVLWNRIERGLNTKVLCRMEICVIATLNKNRELEVKIVDKRNEEIDRVRINDVYDFHMSSSENLIVVSSIAVSEEANTTLIIDPATASIVDHRTGFGGYSLADLEHVLVFGYHGESVITKVFSSEGEEVLESEGVPVLPPYNPFPYPINPRGDFSGNYITLIDRSEIKVFDSYDYSLIYTALKPPLTRGVIDVDVEEPSTTVYTVLAGKPYIAKFDHMGNIRWISHILTGFTYALTSDKLVAVHVSRGGGETRVYRIEGNALIHEESFGPRVYPILVRGDTIILTDGRIISSYSLE